MPKTQPSRLLLALMANHRHTPSITWLCRYDNRRIGGELI
jgi:hypothetical protein